MHLEENKNGCHSNKDELPPAGGLISKLSGGGGKLLNGVGNVSLLFVYPGILLGLLGQRFENPAHCFLTHPLQSWAPNQNVLIPKASGI